MATSPAGPRLSIAKTPAGLVNSRSCGEFYTQDLRPEDVQILLASGKSEKSLWAMAQLDAEEKGVTPDDYLASVQKELLAFYKKREDGAQEVWDREQLLEALRSALATTGQFAMLLGGKNCGKSTVLKNVAGVTNKDKKGGTAVIQMETGQVGRVLCVARARSSPNAHPRYSTDAISPSPRALISALLPSTPRLPLASWQVRQLPRDGQRPGHRHHPGHRDEQGSLRELRRRAEDIDPSDCGGRFHGHGPTWRQGGRKCAQERTGQ